MNKIIDLYNELLNNKISKIELKKRIKGGVNNIDTAINYLKSVDPEAFVNSFIKNFPKFVEKAYDDGKVSEQTVEDSRKVKIIYPSEITDGMYEINKALLDLAKTVKEKKGKTAS